MGASEGEERGISVRVQKVQVFEPEHLKKKKLEVVRLELVVKGLMARNDAGEAGKDDFLRFSSNLRSCVLC